MHIVWVIRRFFPLLLGGTEIRMKQIGEVLLARGYKFTALTRRLEPNLPIHDQVSGIKIHRFPPSSIRFELGVKRWIKDNHQSIDAIHTFRFDKLGLLGRWCRENYQIPHLADIITNELENMLQSNQQAKIERIIKGSDFIHCLNQHTVECLKQQGVPTSKIWYRPNAVNTEVFYPEEVNGDPEQQVTFLFCGRFDNQKGIDFLLSAWKRIPLDLRAKARLLLVGTGEREAEFRRQAVGAPEIIFAGKVNREAIPGYYRRAQIYLHPSKFEGMSNSILEALASGLPVITTDVAGNVDLVSPGHNGFLVSYGDTTELVNAIVILLHDRELRRKMGVNSRKLAESQYAMPVLFDDYDKVYTKLQNRKLRV